ncbi:NucA/NucB deoxyribonuclease domain-containing protein [Paenibacillus hubeiensis]|uniref:NucA/NucB deoxyribonuclease domain-containing protein n=1 Tax=Paenibacillus hubeiensis TaxID=3077330 RepID=UPI0031BA0FE6
MKKLLAGAILAIIMAIALLNGDILPSSKPSDSTPATTSDVDVDRSKVVVLEFPSDRYPETAKHIQDAIESGQPATCTIDRDGAEENRKLSLKGVETKKGYDRDEWPMAMCAEGGSGADIEYISPSDNRGAGSWVGNQLEDYPDGTVVEFEFK